MAGAFPAPPSPADGTGGAQACRGNQIPPRHSPCFPEVVLTRCTTVSLTLEPEIVSWFMLFQPANCMPVSLPCQHFHSMWRAVNYKVNFLQSIQASLAGVPHSPLSRRQRLSCSPSFVLQQGSPFSALPISSKSPSGAFHLTLL